MLTMTVGLYFCTDTSLRSTVPTLDEPISTALIFRGSTLWNAASLLPLVFETAPQNRLAGEISSWATSPYRSSTSLII